MFAAAKLQLALTLAVALLATKTTCAAVSEQCTAEGEVLGNNTDLVAAAPQANCNINGDTGEDSCTFDFRLISSNFSQVCREVGGQLYERDMLWDCTVSLDGSTYNADYTFLNWPACLGASCNVTEIDEEYETVAFPAMEQDLANQGLNCNVSEGYLVKCVVAVLFNAMLGVIMAHF